MKIKWIAFVVLFAAVAATANIIMPIKNILQIPPALESATNVSSKRTEIQKYYMDHRAKFPLKGQPDELKTPFLMSMISYSSLFCEQMISRDAMQTPNNRWVHKQVDFTKPLATWTPEVKKSMMLEYVEIFWQRTPTVAEEALLLTGLDELIVEFPKVVESNFPLLVGFCATVGSGLGFLIN